MNRINSPILTTQRDNLYFIYMCVCVCVFIVCVVFLIYIPLSFLFSYCKISTLVGILKKDK